MSSEVGYYPALKQKQRSTWDSIIRMDVDTVYYSSGTSTERSGSKLILDCREGKGHFYTKTMMALKELLQDDNDWDYIFKTDNSAYIDKEELIHVLKDKPRTEYYGGHLYQTAYVSTHPFFWGEGVALSRDVVKFLVREYETSKIVRSGVEDVHIGILLHELFPWDNSLTIHEFYKKPSLVKNHAYRCKNETSNLEDILFAMDTVHAFFHPPREFSDYKKR